MELSITDIKELLCGTDINKETGQPIDHGYCIAVLDKGFVYVGDVQTTSDWAIILNAKNVRKWTGGHGLSWYAKNGFDKDIIIDDSGDVKVMSADIKHLIICEKRA